MQTVDELKYSQSVWGFQPRKAEIRRVCDVKGLLRDRNHLDDPPHAKANRAA